MFHIHCIQYFFLKGGGPDFSISGGEGKTGFPNWGRLVGGDNLDKMAKNLMKMTKSAFWGQNSGGGHRGGTSQFFG